MRECRFGLAGQSEPIDSAIESWEVRMGWCERRNGKWTPRQVSESVISLPEWEWKTFWDDEGAGEITINKSGVPDFVEFVPRLIASSDYGEKIV